MERIVYEQLMKERKYYEYLKKNSYYLKVLSRRPDNFKYFKEKMQELYKEKPIDKINNVFDSVGTLNSILDTLK